MEATEDFSSVIFNTFKSARYQLIEPCGRGGFSHVYKAYDNQTNQKVAIKVFDNRTLGGSTEHLNRETQFSSLLQHPHIIRLLDRGVSDNFHFAVFEFIQGQSLKQWLFEEGALLPVQAAELMTQVLSALCHCHHLDVIHRDIKPSNIMVTKFHGKLHASLIDFGSATFATFATSENNRNEQADKTLSEKQSIRLSPAYCAPELLTGGQASAQSDLYAWGLVLLECLSGKPNLPSSANISLAINELKPGNVQFASNLLGHPITWLLQRILNNNLVERTANTSEVYTLFEQLDFSTISRAKKSTSVQNANTNPQELDDTQSIHPLAITLPITEQKQITALCLKLSIRNLSRYNDKPDQYLHQDNEFLTALNKNLEAQCINIAERYGATHVSTLGDTLLFYFGYPIVTSSDCYMSAKAAFQVIKYLTKQNTQLSIENRIVCIPSIGIHSGLVTMKNNAKPDGETAQIAISVARLAEKNQILCTRTTREMLSSDIEFKVHKVINLGMALRPYSVHAMLGPRKSTKPTASQPSRAPRMFVGREKELKQLISLTATQHQNPCAVPHMHIVGEAGIGKSRLIFEFRQQIKETKQLAVTCVPESKNQTLHPMFELLKNKYALLSCTNNAAVALLEKHLLTHPTLNHKTALYLICSYLGFVLPKHYICALVSSRETQQILFEAISFLLCKPLDQPSSDVTVIVVEDIDSADLVSVICLQYLAKSPHFIGSKNCLVTSSLTATGRFDDIRQSTTIKIENFNQEETSNFVSQLFNGLSVTTLFANLIFERTDGNPLFIVKFIKMLKDKQNISIIDNKIYLRTTKDILTLPESLRDTLQQKLDQLQSAKNITRLASTIGQEFDLELLSQSYAGDNKQLQMMLDELLNANLIEMKHSKQGQTFTFTHPLLCETAYTSIPENQRRVIHSQIAQVLETKPRSSRQEDLHLALHWLKAGHPEKSNTRVNK